jgi:hypothetical protein
MGARHESGIGGSLWGGTASCGGLATQLATRLFVAWACASVGPVAATERPSATRPQDAILPHKRPSGLGYKYAHMPTVLRLNHAGLHFQVAHPSKIGIVPVEAAEQGRWRRRRAEVVEGWPVTEENNMEADTYPTRCGV